MPEIEELDENESKVLSFKEEGNKYMKSGQHLNAVKEYLKALDLVNNKCPNNKINVTNRLNLYKNLSLAYLKLEDYENAINYATKALEICPSDVKTLLRRSSALEAVERYSDAFKDALNVQKLEPNNTSIQAVLRR